MPCKESIAPALERLSKKYGKLPLSTTLASAIRYARDGFPVDEHYRIMAGHRQSVLQASFESGYCEKIYLSIILLLKVLDIAQNIPRNIS